MINHGIWVKADNQISFLPADLTADNLVVAIANNSNAAGDIMTRDLYLNMGDVLEVITKFTRRRFECFDLKAFVPEVIRRATREDPLFPLLDFLVGSIDSIASMEFKRYDDAAYRRARDASLHSRPDPTLEDTVLGILRFARRKAVAF
jgi:hypothetical protein